MEGLGDLALKRVNAVCVFLDQDTTNADDILLSEPKGNTQAGLFLLARLSLRSYVTLSRFNDQLAV